MKSLSRALVIGLTLTLGLVWNIGDATAKLRLRQPSAGTFFVEPYGGFIIPLNDLDNAGRRVFILETRHWTRLSFGVAIGARAYKPLNLDVGLRLGYSWQSYYTTDGSRDSYDPAINMIELVPFGRMTLFPFNSDTWGISGELGLGLLMPFGGRRGTMDVPTQTQLAFRIRFGLGVMWRLSASQAIAFDAIQVVADLATTAEWKEDVGHQVNLETRVGYQYRF
jgi:hypothetical protein